MEQAGSFEMLWTRVADILAGHRRVVAIGIAVFSLLAALGVAKLEFDDQPQNVFKTSDDDFALLEQIARDFGSDDSDCFVIFSAEDLFTQDTLQTLKAFVREAEQIDDVETVVSLATILVFDEDSTSLIPRSRPLLPDDDATPAQVAAAKQAAMRHPLAGETLLSEEGNHTLVMVRLKSHLQTIGEIEPGVRQLHELAERHSQSDTITIQVSGIPPLRVQIFGSVRTETAKFMVIGAVVSLLMACLMFQRVPLVFIVCMGPGFGMFWTMGAMGLIGQKVNLINVVLPTLVIVIGLTNAIHLIVDLCQSLSAGKSVPVSVREMVSHLGGACGLASLTTAVGFGSLLVSQIEVIRQFGLVCAMGSLLAFLANILVVPLLASFLKEGDPTRYHTVGTGWLSRFLERITRRVIPAALPVAILGTAVTVVMASTVFRLQPDSTIAETTPKHWESYQALQTTDEVFGGGIIATVLIEWEEPLSLQSPELIQVIEQVETVLDEEEATRFPTSILNLLRAMPGERPLSEQTRWLPFLPEPAVSRFLREDLQRTQVTMRLRDRGVVFYEPAFARIRSELTEIDAVSPGIRITLTGTPVVASRNIKQMIYDLGSSLAVACGIIFLMLTFTFRSLRIGLISLVPNLFPLVMISTVIVLSGNYLELTSVMVFTICLGIAVDDTIHLLNRYRRELREQADTEQALLISVSAVGSALVTSTLVLLSGFGSLMLSELPSSQVFATLACTAIASALLGDLLILPAMLIVFHKRKRKPGDL